MNPGNDPMAGFGCVNLQLYVVIALICSPDRDQLTCLDALEVESP
jgi:hypothetical protein